ncbi:hypothetical protein [Serratia marcescens]|uniref:hypothetical protein n=1 Tax=Serratia marcescens TaxID=615 RepID=UPI0038370D48
MSNISDLKDDAIIIIKDRIAGPIGYILFSFIACNWSWIYFLIFSSKTAEVKISTVMTGFEKLPGFGWPIFWGCFLAVVSPFLKLVIVYITSIARQLEDEKNHEIKNHLARFIEKKNLELKKTQQEITERDSKINELIAQKSKLEKSIAESNKIVEMLREEDTKLKNEKIQINSEVHSLKTMLSEYRVTNQTIYELQQLVYNKSSAYNQLKRHLIIFREANHKIMNLLKDGGSLRTTPSSDDLDTLKWATELIDEKMASIDEEYFRDLIIEYTKDGSDIKITSLKNINYETITKLLNDNRFPTNGYTPTPMPDSVILHFKRELTDNEKTMLPILFKQFLSGN